MILFTIHWLIPKTDWEWGVKTSISFWVIKMVFHMFS